MGWYPFCGPCDCKGDIGCEGTTCDGEPSTIRYHAQNTDWACTFGVDNPCNPVYKTIHEMPKVGSKLVMSANGLVGVHPDDGREILLGAGSFGVPFPFPGDIYQIGDLFTWWKSPDINEFDVGEACCDGDGTDDICNAFFLAHFFCGELISGAVPEPFVIYLVVHKMHLDNKVVPHFWSDYSHDVFFLGPGKDLPCKNSEAGVFNHLSQFVEATKWASPQLCSWADPLTTEVETVA